MKLILKGLSLLRQGRFIEFQEKALLKLQHGIAGFKCRFLDVFPRDSLVTTTIKRCLNHPFLQRASNTAHRHLGPLLGIRQPQTSAVNRQASVWTSAVQSKLADDILRLNYSSLVSVVMPTYNRADLLPMAIKSVINQRYQTWELLIVDDGSDDETTLLVEEIRSADARVHYIRTDHRGVSHARNVGLSHSDGSIITYLDSDNSWTDDYLLFVVHYLHGQGFQCAYAAQDLVDGEKRLGTRFSLFALDSIIESNYIDLNVFSHQRSLYEDLGGFDESLKRVVDWDLILKYVKHHQPVSIPAVLCQYSHDDRPDRISVAESLGFADVVRNRHMIDWARLEQEASNRHNGIVSIILLATDEEELQADRLKLLLENTPDDGNEIIIPVNGCKPTTLEMIRYMGRGRQAFQVIETGPKRNRALATNLGLAACSGEFVVILHNEVTILDETEGWLARLIAPLRDNPRVGLVAPKVLDADGTLLVGPVVYQSDTHRAYPLNAGLPGQHPAVVTSQQCQALADICIAARFQDLVALCGLHTFYSDDSRGIDLSFRIRSILGKELLYNPSSEVSYQGNLPWFNIGSSRDDRQAFSERWPAGAEVCRQRLEIQDTGAGARLRVGIKIAAEDKTKLKEWGDFHFALAIKRELQRLGHVVRIDIMPNWETHLGLGDDFVLVLRGLSRYKPLLGPINIMWNISHPDKVEFEEYEAYDHVS